MNNSKHELYTMEGIRCQNCGCEEFTEQHWFRLFSLTEWTTILLLAASMCYCFTSFLSFAISQLFAVTLPLAAYITCVVFSLTLSLFTSLLVILNMLEKRDRQNNTSVFYLRCSKCSNDIRISRALQEASLKRKEQYGNKMDADIPELLIDNDTEESEYQE